MRINIDELIDPQKLGNAIKTYRAKADMTQENLANILDISPTYISQIERGIHAPSLQTFLGICLALKVDPASLLEISFTDKQEFIIPSQCIELCNVTKDLRQEQIDSLVEIVKQFSN